MARKNTRSNNQNTGSLPETKASGSISHAAAILLCLSEDIHTVSEIARQCGLGKSTVHRVLKLLEDSDMVMQDPFNRNYYLGSLIARLNSNPLTSHEYLIIFSIEEMKKLSGLFAETVTLDIFIGMQLVPIFEIPSLHDLKVTENKSTGGPLHTGASRKVLLAQLGDKQLASIMDSSGRY